jgi:hypothetical protein
MALDAIDTIKSTFGSLKTDAGMKIFGLLFLVQLANMGSAYLGTTGTGLTIVSGLISLIAGVAMILITVGAFRSFDSGEVNSDQYTNNILWPVIRITGANLVTTIFAYGLALVALLPALLLAALTGAGVSSLGTAGAGIVGGVLGLVGLLLGGAAFFYIFLMLTLSIPMISVDDNRIFEALDRSVQRTAGEKVSMFLAAVPVGLLYLVGIGLVLASGAAGTAQTASPVVILVSSAVTGLTATLFFALLNEYHQRLPE